MVAALLGSMVFRAHEALWGLLAPKASRAKWAGVDRREIRVKRVNSVPLVLLERILQVDLVAWVRLGLQGPLENPLSVPEVTLVLVALEVPLARLASGGFLGKSLAMVREGVQETLDRWGNLA